MLARRGFTVAELLAAMMIAAIVMSIAFPRAQLILDSISVQGAATDVQATLHAARSWALASHASVAVDVDSGTLRVRHGEKTLFTRNIGSAHGVQLSRSRDSLAFGPLGLGRGAANLSIVVRRRAAVETVFVSRLGRIR